MTRKNKCTVGCACALKSQESPSEMWKQNKCYVDCTHDNFFFEGFISIYMFSLVFRMRYTFFPQSRLNVTLSQDGSLCW